MFSSRFITGKKRRLCPSSSLSFRRYVSDTPILIVGGGPTGLYLANLLQSYQIPFTLLESQTTQSRFRHPQAHFINTRSMELLRHTLPFHVYDSIQSTMPPLDEWKRFRFGPDMKSKAMAEVLHPVDRPLSANQDANGTLVNRKAFGEREDINRNLIELSDCSVGHLAQHTFSRILYDTAMEHESAKDQIFYNMQVIAASHENGVWKVSTESGKEFQSPVVIAADGAWSWWRNHLDIPMNGQPTIQHLINVHFTLEEPEDNFPPAMLYTIFSPDVLAMVVRHAPKEYVMQIPYFARYQSLEDDFTKAKVQKMISAALGGSEAFKIRSIKPWTMGSLVAQEYYKQQVFFVGDAAHVFPPAGGFGMNTGLQDAHNLAWRLALQQPNVSERTTKSIGQAYEADRQPVARQNAALSIRNYQRVLGVMNACYLNHHHPSFLIQGLDASSFFVPLEIRRQTFQTALQTALWPLGQLKTSPEGFFAKRVTSNLNALLNQGQGLPLLFPSHEVGFRYRTSSTDKNIDDSSSDTFAQSPCIVEGGLFPHLSAVVHESANTLYPRLCLVDNNTITTRDLPAQLSTLSLPCTFCLLNITITESNGIDENCSTEILQELKQKLDYPCKLAKLKVVDGATKAKCPPSTDEYLYLQAEKHYWESIHHDVPPARDNMMVLIRPDGHVASVCSFDHTEDDPSSVVEMLLEKALLYI